MRSPSVLRVMLLVLLAGLATPTGVASADRRDPAAAQSRRFAVTAHIDPKHPGLHQRATLVGVVRPARPRTQVVLRTRRGDQWVTVTRSATSKNGRFRFRLDTSRWGTTSYRVRVPPVGAVAATTSRTYRIRITEPPGPPAFVPFTIPDGTGSGQFNTSETRVVAEVGEVLAITNADSEAHRLHTDGTPFADPSADIAPGETAYFQVTEAFSGDYLYCETHGADSRFYLTVSDPEASDGP